jgi:hypothetical protein
VPFGVTKSALTDSMQGNQCIAVLRSQLGFGGDRRRKLNEFVAAVLGHRKFYNLIAVASFPKRSAEYFANQLEFVRKNYGEVTSHEEFAKQSFFCSAFVVACYALVGIIGETAQVAYQPNNFSPGHLGAGREHDYEQAPPYRHRASTRWLAARHCYAPPDCNFPPSISPVLPLAPAVAARTRSRAQFRLGSWDSCQWPYDKCRCRRRG